MSNLLIGKVLSALPGALAPNMIYAVRLGAGFDLYITDSTGQIAYRQNANGAPVVILTQAQYDALATKDPNTLYAIKAS